MKNQTYWEYKYVYMKSDTNDIAKIEGLLNDLGNQGWELTYVVEAGDRFHAKIHGYFFKRPKL
ncbi:MAG: DUF4177 domain-containing protein [Candidatus Kariarchaeaceae archaeon]|jgi:hypothetical protein